MQGLNRTSLPLLGSAEEVDVFLQGYPGIPRDKHSTTAYLIQRLSTFKKLSLYLRRSLWIEFIFLGDELRENCEFGRLYKAEDRGVEYVVLERELVQERHIFEKTLGGAERRGDKMATSRFQALKFGHDLWDPSHRFETSWLLPPWVLFAVRALIVRNLLTADIGAKLIESANSLFTHLQSSSS